MTEGFWFFGSFRDAARHLSDQDRLALYDALMDYALDGIEPEQGGVVGAMMALMMPNIDANKARLERNRANGSRPKSKPGATEERETSDTEATAERDGSEAGANEKRNEATAKAIEKDKEKEKDKDKDIGGSGGAQPRHKYGEYKHVLLSDAELARLDDEYGHDVVKRAIKVVDEYCQTSGKRYKDYNLVIRHWGIDRARRGPTKQNAFAAIQSNTYDYAALERELVENA